MMHPRYSDTFFFGVCISFLLGVLLRSELYIPFPVLIFILISAFSFCVFLFQTQRVYALFIMLFALCFVFGIVRFEMKDLYHKAIFQSFSLESSYEGIVIDEPEYNNSYQRLVIKVSSENHTANILVSTERYPEFEMGDRVSLEGEIRYPENFITDTGKEFNYVEYLANKNILFTMSFAQVSLIESRAEKHLERSLIQIKHGFLNAIQRVTPEPEQGLLAGILLGVQNGINEDLEEKFIATGTIHIVVLSGYNITIISEAIVKSLQRFFPEKLALSFGSFGIVLFVLMTGAGTTSIRAGLMGLLGLLARVTNRNYDIVRGLFFAGFLMVLLNPFALVYDISFQLSFIATLGLILVTPLVERWRFVRLFPERFALREIFASTLATQITVLPFLLYKIGTLSIVAPLVNMLILPFIPLAMGIGALSGFLEMITHVGSNPISWISFGLLHYIVSIVDWFGSLSFSAVVIRRIPLTLVLVLYVCILMWIWKNKKVILRF